MTDTPAVSELSALWSLLEEALERSTRGTDAAELEAVAELCRQAAAAAERAAERLRGAP